MKKRNRAIIIAGIVAFVICIMCFMVTPVRNEIIYFYHFQTGNFTDAQKEAMKKTDSGEPANFIAEKDGREYMIPLPNGATEYPGGGYIVINYEFYDNYYEKIKNLDGYKFDQMGSYITLKSDNGEITFHISVINTARRYELLEITYYFN